MASDPKQRLTVQEYLTLERQSETKSDYLAGEMFAMTGASRKHNLIVTNVLASLHPQLADRACEVYASDMRVRTPSGLFTYPDVVAVCGEPRFDDIEFDTLLNPTLIVEVLSRSTEAYDRLTKLDHYRGIPSLAEVVFVAQDRPRVEHWLRQDDGRWLIEEIDDLGRNLALPSIGCELPLRTIYRRVFDEGGDGPAP
jgi:Uma2 family endonuclease